MRPAIPPAMATRASSQPTRRSHGHSESPTRPHQSVDQSGYWDQGWIFSQPMSFMKSRRQTKGRAQNEPSSAATGTVVASQRTEERRAFRANRTSVPTMAKKAGMR